MESEHLAIATPTAMLVRIGHLIPSLRAVPSALVRMVLSIAFRWLREVSTTTGTDWMTIAIRSWIPMATG
jgi:hypothetical protein